MVYLFAESCGWTIEYIMNIPLSILYKLMDARGLREWSANLLRLNLAAISGAPSEEAIDSVISSVTPDDPWCFLDKESREEDEDIFRLELEFPDDFKHIVEV